jgi:hypothetical protein
MITMEKDYTEEKNYIEVACSGICCQEKLILPLKQGWTGTADVESFCYCPDKQCQLQKEYFDSVCGGCVEMPKDCSLYRFFAHSYQFKITKEDILIILKGHCPFRTNGSLFINNDRKGLEIQERDISDKASSESGLSICKGIYDYLHLYSQKDLQSSPQYPQISEFLIELEAILKKKGIL